MNNHIFHHPDISLTVLGRRTLDFALDCVQSYAQLATTRGHSYLLRGCFPSDVAYRSAIYRLRKAGVIVSRRKRDGARRMEIVPAQRSLRPELHPHKAWGARWDGLWRVLVYDIDERERRFRDGLRRALRAQRLGCLQQSVWVSPRDIRPIYADLQTAINIDSVACLFEARTVLGRAGRDVVDLAWDFDGLAERQRSYIAAGEGTLDRLSSGRMEAGEAASLARAEMAHYLHAMSSDPLLPSKLLPPGYMGRTVYDLHLKIMKALAPRLSDL